MRVDLSCESGLWNVVGGFIARLLPQPPPLNIDWNLGHHQTLQNATLEIWASIKHFKNTTLEIWTTIENCKNSTLQSIESSQMRMNEDFAGLSNVQCEGSSAFFVHKCPATSAWPCNSSLLLLRLLAMLQMPQCWPAIWVWQTAVKSALVV